MSGKKKCKILKQIRQQIALNNDIEYVVEECPFQGECKGTCPRCEEEVRYLERELEKRRKAGKVVVIAGVAASLAIGTASCVAVGNEVGEAIEKLFESTGPTGAVEAIPDEMRN